MFYSTQILARRGPLGLVWMAAHMHQQLKRSQVAGTQLAIAVDALLHPETPLALRLSGQLLLGLVRLLNKQAVYLHQDCQDALVRIRLAFQLGTLHGSGGAHTLPEQDDSTVSDVAPVDDQGWGVMVDLMEAQLLRATQGTAGQLVAENSLGYRLEEALLPLDLLQLGPSAAVLRRQSISGIGMAQSPAHQPQAGPLKLKHHQPWPHEEHDDVMPLRDQTNTKSRQQRGRSMTPAPSRIASQAESLFAAVATALNTSGRQAQDTAGGWRSSQLGMPHGDEMFDVHADLPFDINAVEVEALREGPSTSVLQNLNTRALLGGADVLHRGQHSLLQSQPSPGQRSSEPHLLHTPSTNKADQAQLGLASGRQGSKAAANTPGSGLLDMELDMGDALAVPGLPLPDLHFEDLPLSGHDETGAQEPGKLTPQSHPPAERGGQASQQPSADMAPADEQHIAGPDSTRRMSTRVKTMPTQQPLLAPLPPAHPAARQHTRTAKPLATCPPLPLALLPKKRSLPVDTPGSGVRKGADVTVRTAAECRKLQADTSSLQTVRGLAAYRQAKRQAVQPQLQLQLPPNTIRAGGVQIQLGNSLLQQLQQLRTASVLPTTKNTLSIQEHGQTVRLMSPLASPLDGLTRPGSPAAPPSQQQHAHEAVGMRSLAIDQGLDVPLQPPTQPSASLPPGDASLPVLEHSLALASSGHLPAGLTAASLQPPPADAPLGTPGAAGDGSLGMGASTAAAPSQHLGTGVQPDVCVTPQQPGEDEGMEAGEDAGLAVGLGLASQQPATRPARLMSSFSQPGQSLQLQLADAGPLELGRTPSGWPSSGSFDLATGSTSQRTSSAWAFTDRAQCSALQAVTRAIVSQLPPELQSQVPSQVQPSQPWDGSPAASQAGPSQAGPGLPQACSQEVLDSLVASAPVQLSQVLGGTLSQAPGTRLRASKTFFDMLVLCSRGLVTLSQDQQQDSDSQVPCPIMLSLTQQGAEACCGTQAQ